MARALAELRVLELGQEIAAPYCTKLLADLGADVIKVERPGGDPLRAHGEGSRLFRYLNANKRSALLDLRSAAGADAARQLVAGADLVVENFRPGALEALGLGPAELRAENSRLALVRISSFGQSGPYRDAPVTDLVLQAAGGWVGAYDSRSPTPVRVGGRMPEYVSGAFAACAALTAVQSARERDEFVDVDLSIQECLVGTLPYPMLMAEALRAAPRPAPPATYVPFGIQRCRDGYVGINVLTQAHWINACRALEVPEFADSRLEVSTRALDYEAFRARLRESLDRLGAAEITERCQALRIPAATVANAEALLASPQISSRPFFVDEPGGDFERPGPPFRLSATPVVLDHPAPGLPDASAAPARWRARDAALPFAAVAQPGLPFRGLRVLDLGTFWAGPYLGMYLASLGADVIKVESIQRPDGFRFVAPADSTAEGWTESGALFQATNLGKRDVTLDLGSADGRALLLRLVERADVLVENYAPRVMERFGLDYDALRAARRDLVVIRMPAYGLEGPWRDYVGWAMALAQASGLSWLTGEPDDPLPRNPGSFIDPAIAMHAGVALQAALAHRRRAGEGQLVEMAQLETVICMCPEPVLEYTATGRVLEREGNRSQRYAPQGVYPCRDGHVALSVRGAADWDALIERVGDREWARDPELANASGRRRRADELDARLRGWTQPQPAADVVALLRGGGIPAAKLLLATEMYGEPQLEARGFYQSLDHPVTGKRRYPVWPMRFSFAGPNAHPSGAPTLGQHNDEVLGSELGVGPEERARLRREGVIGERWSPGAG